MKKFFSLVLALVMALSLTTVAWGADALALKDANGVIQLAENTAYDQITDLTGVTKIVGATGATVAGINFIGAVSGLTLENVTFTKDVYFAGGNVTNLTVNKCKFSNASLQLHMHRQDMPVYTAENLVVTNCEFDGVSSELIPFEAATHKKTSIWGQNLNGATFTGNTITGSAHNAIQFDVSVEGAIEISNNTISNTGDRALRFGPVKSGATLAIQDNNVTNGVDDNGEVMKATSLAADVTVKAWNNDWDGGTVVNAELADIGSGVTTDANGLITGGTFTSAPAAAWVAPGFVLTQNAGGGYTANPDTAGNNSAAEYALWKADITATTAVVAKGAYETVAATTNATNGSGTLEYVKMGGMLFVKVPANKATTQDFYVCGATDKTKTPLFYLKQIDSVADVSYILPAVKFTDFGVKCGQMNAAYVDITTNEAGFYVFTNPVTGVKMYFTDYVALNLAAPYYGNSATKTVTIVNFGNILVDGEIVKAYMFSNMSGVATSPLNAHVWAPSAYDKTTPVKALCGICGAQANLYKDGKIPAKSVVDAVLNLGGTNYNVVITSAGSVGGVVVTPSTDKVTSAETFDAGIAMYVGMSVMAAAGSAVVIGKKKD